MLGALQGPLKLFSSAANHSAAAIACAKNKGGLDDGRINNHAICFIDQVLRNVVGYIHNFLNHQATIFQAVIYFLVAGLKGKSKSNQDKSQEQWKDLFHSFHLFDSIDDAARDIATWRCSWGQLSLCSAPN